MRQVNELEDDATHIPWTLVLNPGGEPLRWIKYERYAYYKSRDSIVWSLGKREYTLRGGINPKTMQQSTLPMESIIAIRNESGRNHRAKKPALTNAALFSRDNNTCAYCGGKHSRVRLTRDHVQPVSKNGPDIWENVVTCCFDCNQKKGNHLLEECGMKLLYLPYAPTHHENLILKNKNISKEQLEYLMVGVSPHSRVYKDYAAGTNKDHGEINEFA